ncbi:M23 family metallopeptidase [Sphingomonas aracearum]|uniref:M23 family peptidase n=1 Tax=Sphingomonas aracearum TaxID=2283317 RepID=A0A369VSI4_9SPHN|nr:M23 family metallopeptidase [Sphingomonas aracearum]RDE05348.1 M23 family peptidase [Sphingomonas aracearum]
MRRLGIAAALVLAAVVALWIAALKLLPDAPADRPRPVPASTAAVAQLPGLLHVPVRGVARSALRDSWGDARAGGARAHHGLDIPAPAGTPVEAAAAGMVEKLFESHDGGTTVYVRSPDRRWSYYYAHLAGYAPGLAEGQAVQVGTPLGFVGDTGNAGAGNFHLHFGLSRTAPDQHWAQGEEVDPFPYLVGRAPRR